MSSREQKLDAHARPPEELKSFYKKYQKLKANALAEDDALIDLTRIDSYNALKLSRDINYKGDVSVTEDSSQFPRCQLVENFRAHCRGTIQEFVHRDMPGLKIIPNLLPKCTQVDLLNALVHRDVSNPAHQSNLHLHYNVQYPAQHASFFSLDPSLADCIQEPKDPSVHKPLSTQHMLNKKLRWITLGGQYDWTNKVYPSEQPPQFPPDLAELLRVMFPQMIPQAAIVNFYSPGDTLSLHRDVAEECSRGLISLSIGCDGIFVLGLEGKMVAMRLRSGDAVYMDGASRYAWHGVPQIIPNTCPEWLRDWPGDQFQAWRGWMASKRVNLNVRQIWDQNEDDQRIEL
ncbi:alkylated DNA repair protein AlkB [Verruconis gallopava]|uniref:mRNA N(6)-methyladenine demethylase n=1 Tax=Verruconis gallopava TaxID=253628 RepID=A0A0D1XNW0_9PEZI|nr:alkylated DNA repair protein AlkB [Verruconis gallopava]KIW04261.1 alkylated DNA repair protein AlkB [Verruconis gallopava]